MVADFSTARAARLVGLPPHRLRAWARQGIIGHAGLAPQTSPEALRPFRFSFSDLSVLRMASGLLRGGLAPARLMQGLKALKDQACRRKVLLSSTRLICADGRLLARDAQALWDTESGQTVLSFAPLSPDLAETPAAPTAEQDPPALGPLVNAASAGGPVDPFVACASDNADTWFDRAQACEQTDPQQAYACYLKTLACNPEHVEAAVNLGCLCVMGGDFHRAQSYFHVATSLDPAHAVAHYNLGTTQEAFNRHDLALQSYRLALMYREDFIEAHLALAELLEQLGRAAEARRHRRRLSALYRSD